MRRDRHHVREKLDGFPAVALRFGDVLFPSHVGSLNGIAAVESTTVRISGEAVMDLAKELRKHPGHDIARPPVRVPLKSGCPALV